MAKGPEQGAPKPRSQASTVLVWVAIAFVVVVYFAIETVLFLSLAMLPTIVAYIIDRSPQKYATFCVGGMNFSGSFLYLMDLWAGERSVSSAMALITDVWTLLTILSAAAFGWMLFVAIPPVIATVLTVMAQRRLSLLRTTQLQLVQEWGESVGLPDGEPQSEGPEDED